ncbi:hypothetical protein E2C01_054606 [Portunus trituberculatus]|uniref:Uncharacterized protein n=1 Tax=Portunus trituberculatus TaxID=210409 RepID=A0A5B7GTN6_PORTR|nr:hypothetical protein [Portunus trituberculatus]
MSSKDTVSECDTEIDSECPSDIPPSELQSDHLSHLELASSVSFGDLSMGSDSVFISESEAPSRRHSDQTVGSSYITDDQESLIATKSSLLSPGTKHVHFKFDGDTPSTVSEDETQSNSPNYAKTVMSNYLSSHRNSISQVIEALSSLAQADITAEIEMTIEQNKRQKSSEQFPSRVNINGHSSPDKSVIGDKDISANSVENSQILTKSVKKPIGKDEEAADHYTVSTTIDISPQSSASEAADQRISAIHFQKGSVNTEVSTADLICSLTDEISKQQQNTESGTVPTTTLESSNIKSSHKKIHRKSILKNTACKSILSPDVAKTENTTQQECVERTRHQLTPTLRRKPILKNVEALVSSSCSKYQDVSNQKVLCKQDESQKDMNSKVQIGNSKVNRYVAKSKPLDQTFKSECQISLSKFDMERKLSADSDRLDMRSARWSRSDKSASNSTRLCSSLPATPILTRKEHVSSPNKLPLSSSYNSLSENQRDSKIPRLSKSNDSTPVSTPKQVRKLSPRGENCNKISREPSSDNLTGITESPKRNIWSEPSSPLTTPQLIRKTFKQIHESTKIPMPIYQYSSTEELEDSSPQESPRPSREKRQRCLVRPPRTMSVDRGMDQSHRKFSDETVRTSRTRSPLPVAPKLPSPSGKPTTPEVSQPSSPLTSRSKSPVPVKPSSSLQSSNIYTNTRSSSVTVLSPVTSRKSLFSASASTPVMSQHPGPTQVKTQNTSPDSVTQITGDITLGTSPAKVSRISKITLFPLKEPVNRNSPQKSFFSKCSSISNSKQCSNIISEGEDSCKGGNSENLKRADSLEEFLLLENECMD